MSNDLERVDHRPAEAKDKVEGKEQLPKSEKEIEKEESSQDKDEDSQQEQAEQYFKQMIDQSLGESRQRQASGTFGNGSSAMFSLSQSSESQTNNNAGFANSKDSNPSAGSDESAPELVSTAISTGAAAATTTTVTASTGTVPVTASGANVPTLWTSESAFFKSVDSFINKFKSTDSFAALAETHDFHSSNTEATEALREFLVSRSLQKDSVLSQEWVPQYEPAHQDVDTTAVFSQQSAAPLPPHAASLSQQDRLNQIPSLSQDSTFSAASLAWLKEIQEKNNSASSAVEAASESATGAAAKKAGTKKVEELPVVEGLSQDSTLSLASLAWMKEMYEKSNTTAVSSVPLVVTSVGSENTSAEMVAAAALIESATSLPLHAGGKGGKRKRQGGGSGKKGSSGGRGESPERVYHAPTDQDVLCGRGGRTNHHSGNKVYLVEKEKIQKRYLAASKQDKTAISQELVDRIHALGGRFLEQDELNARWYEISALKARKKASQTLRELNTPEERKAKRERYAK